MEILKLSPAFKDYLWGGTRLITEYGKTSNFDKVAESWELSAHKDGPSIIMNGSFEGKNFIEYLTAEGSKAIGSKGEKFGHFPVLIKFIDAKQNLSIQVHPDDEYAQRVEHESGKNEFWYILDAKPGSYLYYGVKKEMTKEDYRKHIEDDTICDYLNKVMVKKGDCFFIKAGTIHAIGAGCMICEIQQSSNSTYRVYDFGRLGVDGKPRELHIDKAVDVSSLVPSGKNGEPQEKPVKKEGYVYTLLSSTEYFTTAKYDIEEKIEFNADADSFNSLIILEGSGKVTAGSQTVEFKKGESIFIPAGFGKYVVEGTCSVIKTNL